jgi:hypothetical protein
MIKQTRALLAIVGGFALFMWAVAVCLGTGIGYDHPIIGLFDDGILSSLWRLSKAGFLGVLALATISVASESLSHHSA